MVSRFLSMAIFTARGRPSPPRLTSRMSMIYEPHKSSLKELYVSFGPIRFAETVFIGCIRTKETKISQLSYPRPMRLRTVMTMRTVTTSVLKMTAGVKMPISSGPLLMCHSDSGISEDVVISVRQDSQDLAVYACFEWFRESRARLLRAVGGGKGPYIYCTLTLEHLTSAGCHWPPNLVIWAQ